MKKLAVLTAIFALGLACCGQAVAMGGEHAPGQPIGGSSNWPEGLAAIMNDYQLVYGFWVNANDSLYFAGNTEKFNTFIERCSKLKAAKLNISLHCGRGTVTRAFTSDAGDPMPFDWSVTISAWQKAVEGVHDCDVNIGVWLGGKVEFGKLSIPLSASVGSGGEMEKFVAEHQKKQGQAAQRPGFGVYLLKDESIAAAKALELELDRLELRNEPLLAVDDFESYRWSDHSFVLTAGAVNRLPTPGLPGVPFVVVVDGERAYLGAFYSVASSAEFPAPVVLPELAGRKKAFRIKRAYPGPRREEKDDPRAHPAIKAAFEKAGKLAE